MKSIIPKPKIPDVPFPLVPDSKDLLPKGLDRPGEILKHLTEITEKEKRAVLHNIDQQIDKYENDLKRFEKLLKEKVYKEIQPVLDAKDKINDTIKKLKKSKDIIFDHYKTLKTQYIKTFTTIRTDVSTYIFKELHLEKINEFANLARRAKADAQTATSTLANLGILNKKYKKQLDALIGNDEETKERRDNLQKDIDDTLEKMGIERDKITEAVETGEKVSRNLKKFKENISKISKTGILDNISKGMTEIGLDINKARGEVTKFVNEMSDVTDLLANGYTNLYESMVIGEDAEKISEIWKNATDRTAMESEREMKNMAKELEELDKLAKFEDKEAFLKLASKYSSPSRRMFIQTREEFAALKESSEAKNILAIISDYADATIKALGESVKILGTYVTERVVGEVAARAILKLAKVMGEAATKIVAFASGLGEAVMAGVALYYTIKDGFTFRAFNDAFSLVVGVSAQSIQDQGSRLHDNYNDRTTVLGVSKTETETAIIDSKELNSRIDFWGAAYVDELKARNKHYTDYIKMKEPKVYQRVVGRYIKDDDHPWDQDVELEECRRMENELEQIDKQNAISFTGILGSGSQVFRHYPKKEGYTRNLVNFPFYKKTFKWPEDKYSKGSLYQTQGIFNKSDIDKNLIELFEGWVTSGKYGPMYSKAETKEAKQIAIDVNLRDYQQWINPQQNKETMYTELNEWIKRGKGALAIYYNDMLILSPETFDWGKPDDTPPHSWFPYDVQTIFPYTLEYFTHHKNQVGRWTYGNNHLKFYLSVKNNHKIYVTKRIFYPSFAIYGEYRKATPEEINLFSDIYDRGYAQKQYLSDVATGVQNKWSRSDVLDAIWGDYRRDIGVDNIDPSKSERNTWSYIYKFRSIFMNELENKVRTMMQERKNALMQDYKRVVDDKSPAMNVEAAGRTFFMGQLNSVAFTDKPEFTAEELILQNFKDITQNILVTKKGVMKPWAKRVTSISSIPDETDTEARIFVTSGPASIIVVFNTPENEEEDIFDITHAESIFLRVEETKTDAKTHVRTPNLSIVHIGEFTDDEMVDRDDIIQVRYEVWKQWISIEDAMITRLANLIVSTDVENVFLTGYGRSAEVAQIAALRIPRSFMRKKTLDRQFRLHNNIVDIKDPHCYLFASRYIGDRRFAINFGALTDEVVQVWIDGDLNVQLPPLILPDKEKFPAIYEKQMDTLKIMTTKYNYFAGELYLLKTAFGDKKGEIGQYVNMIEDSEQKTKFSDYNLNRLELDMENILKSNVHFQGYRGNGIFLRLNESGSGAYETNHKDPGNSSMSLGHLVKNEESASHIKRIHSLEEILDELLYEINQHTEDFELTKDGMANWDATGEINAPPKPGQLPHIPKKIIDELISGEKRIVGYAHTKHNYPSGTVVPDSDVDEWMTLPKYDPLDLLDERQRNKRRKVIIDTGEDYHGSYY